ncbi:putative quinol monooxygenase [Acinetobacter sp. 243_ASPC]|uniref:putative quinol monooxygenase n=1 Tax=Acinetobacter sp. 243_ASPC TaxID=1579345 RepID=UPI00065FF64A|nr:putative quinol monooxygenase [Acinetobacter sp. 243_ASPC]
MITVIAEIKTHAGAEHREAVLAALHSIRTEVLAEDGCHGYQPMIDHASEVSFQRHDAQSIVMLEHWESVAHLQTAHMQAYQARVKAHVIEVDIRILDHAC